MTLAFLYIVLPMMMLIVSSSRFREVTTSVNQSLNLIFED
jgi:hypothetical protein